MADISASRRQERKRHAAPRMAANKAIRLRFWIELRKASPKL